MADTNTSSDIDLQQLLASLTAPQAPPAPPPVDYAATAPTSASGLLGERLAGGPPSAFPLSQAQRDIEGNRDLLGFARGLMSGGPFARGGDVLAGGLQGAAGAQANAEVAAAGQQQAAQEWQNTTQANRIEMLKAQLPLLTLQAQINASKVAAGIATGGATTPGTPGSGTSLATVARDPKAGTAGQQANNPGNVMSTNAPGQSGVMNLSGGRTLAVFPDLTTGIAANAANLGSYATAHGISTVADAVKRWTGWTPDSGLDLTSYTNDIAKALGVKPTDKIDLTDPAVQSKFIMAQQPHESGKLWLSQADVDKGVALAQQWRQKGAPGAVAAAAPPTGSTAPPAASAVAPGVTMAEPGVPPPPPPGPPGAAPGTVASIGAALNPQAAAATTLPVPPIPPSMSGKGSPIPAGNLQSTGQPPVIPPPVRKMSDADIVMQGIRTAQATPVLPGAPLAAGGDIGKPAPLATAPPAGPAPNVWGAPAPPSAVLNYNGGTTTPPAQPTPQLASKQPTDVQYPPVTVGGITVRHPGDFKFDPSTVSFPSMPEYDPSLPPDQAAGFQRQIAEAIAMGPAGIDKLQAAEAARTTAIADRIKDVDAARRLYADQQRKDAYATWGSDLKVYTDARQKAMDAVTTAGTEENNEAMTTGKSYRDASRSMDGVLQLVSQMRPLLAALPGPSQSRYLSTDEKRNNAGILGQIIPEFDVSKNISSTDVYTQLQTRLAAMLTPTAATTPERAAYVEAMKGSIPGILTDPEARKLGLGMITTYADRMQRESDFVDQYLQNQPQGKRSVLGMAGAMRSSLGDLVPTMPQSSATGQYDDAGMKSFWRRVPSGGVYHRWMGRDANGRDRGYTLDVKP